MKLLRILAALPLALAALSVAAFAQTAPTIVVTQIDLSPIIANVISLLGAALGALAIWIGWYVKNLVASKVDLSNTKIDEQVQQTYNEAAARAIAYAESALKGAVPGKVDTNNQYVATAASYLIKFWPDLVAKLGLTEEKVRETILARLPSGAATDKADAIVLAKAGTSPPAVDPKQ